jgi:hypothetical protein
MGSIAGYLAWVLSVGGGRASQVLDGCSAKIVRMPNKPSIAENLFFCPA